MLWLNRKLTKTQIKDLCFFIAPFIFYGINELIKFKVSIPVFGYFFRYHFNDYLGGISFAAYVNLILSFSNWTTFRFTKIKHFIVEGLICGIAWEVITPMFLSSSTGDKWDIVAYIAGMLTYWLLAIHFSIQNYNLKGS